MSYQAVLAVLAGSASKGATRLVAVALAAHTDPDGTNAFPSTATLAREANVSRRAVQYALRELVERGEIEATGLSSHGTLVYRVRLRYPTRAVP